MKSWHFFAHWKCQLLCNGWTSSKTVSSMLWQILFRHYQQSHESIFSLADFLWNLSLIYFLAWILGIFPYVFLSTKGAELLTHFCWFRVEIQTSLCTGFGRTWGDFVSLRIGVKLLKGGLEKRLSTLAVSVDFCETFCLWRFCTVQVQTRVLILSNVMNTDTTILSVLMRE